jgi:flagellin-like protein
MCSYIVMSSSWTFIKVFETMAFTKNEEAVSPVIGVILMVAITVILAAVIAAFVFGMAGNISKTKVVAATVQQPDANTIVVTYQGGQDASSFDFGTVSITKSDATLVALADYTNGTATGTGTQNILGKDVGSSVTATDAGEFAGKDHVVVTGTFTDGSSQVILDNFV